MHIHSRALKYFDMIRRCGSIREAARQLHVSSSAVNRQLLQLEDEVGSPLFERLSRGLRLTPVGEILSRHVITVLQDAQRMSGELDALKKGIRRGAVDVVAVETLCGPSGTTIPAHSDHGHDSRPARSVGRRRVVA